MPTLKKLKLTRIPHLTQLNLNVDAFFLNHPLRPMFKALPPTDHVETIHFKLTGNGTRYDLQPLMILIGSCFNLSTLNIDLDDDQSEFSSKFLYYMLKFAVLNLVKLKNLTIKFDDMRIFNPYSIENTGKLVSFSSLEIMKLHFNYSSEGPALNDLHLKSYIQAFEKMTELKQFSLIISGKLALTSAGILSLFDSLKQNTNLKSLEFGLAGNEYPIDDETMSQIYSKIQWWKPTLETLALHLTNTRYNTMYKITDVSLVKLADTLHKLRKLSNLQLYFRGITRCFKPSAFGYFMEDGVSACNLKKFSLSFIDHEDRDDCLVLNDKMMKQIATCVSKQHQLEAFELEWPERNATTDVGLIQLYEALASCPNLQTFFLNCDNSFGIVTDESLHALYKSLVNSNKLVNFGLKLSGSLLKLTDLSLIWLSKLLKTNTNLQKLKLCVHSYHPFGGETTAFSDTGLKELYKTISHCRILKDVFLSLPTKEKMCTDKTLRIAEKTISSLAYLERLHLQMCSSRTQSSFSMKQIKKLLQTLGNKKRIQQHFLEFSVKQNEQWEVPVVTQEIMRMFKKCAEYPAIWYLGINDNDERSIELSLSDLAEF
jgi:hypothetical protein